MQMLQIRRKWFSSFGNKNQEHIDWATQLSLDQLPLWTFLRIFIFPFQHVLSFLLILVSTLVAENEDATSTKLECIVKRKKEGNFLTNHPSADTSNHNGSDNFDLSSPLTNWGCGCHISKLMAILNYAATSNMHKHSWHHQTHAWYLPKMRHYLL